MLLVAANVQTVRADYFLVRPQLSVQATAAAGFSTTRACWKRCGPFRAARSSTRADFR
jgi:hypothetical protein